MIVYSAATLSVTEVLLQGRSEGTLIDPSVEVALGLCSAV